jgi:hypothetical protein
MCNVLFSCASIFMGQGFVCKYTQSVRKVLEPRGKCFVYKINSKMCSVCPAPITRRVCKRNLMLSWIFRSVFAVMDWQSLLQFRMVPVLSVVFMVMCSFVYPFREATLYGIWQIRVCRMRKKVAESWTKMIYCVLYKSVKKYTFICVPWSAVHRFEDLRVVKIWLWSFDFVLPPLVYELKIYKTIILPVILYGLWNFVSNMKGKA